MVRRNVTDRRRTEAPTRAPASWRNAHRRLASIEIRSLAIWTLVLALSAWTVVRLLGVESHYLLVALVAYTPYAAVAAVGAAILAAVVHCPVPMVMAAASALALIVTIAPRAIRDAPRPPATDARTLRVLTANVDIGHASARALVSLVTRDAVDVLSVQELTPAMVLALDDAGIGTRLPGRILRPRPGAAGTGLYARWPLHQVTPPAGTTFAMTAAETHVAGAGPLELVAVHAAAPRSRSAMVSWRQDLRTLPPPRPDLSRVLAGDFNATLDHAEFRRLIARGYRDAAATAGAGLVPTWPNGRLLPGPITIDHVLVDRRWQVGRVQVQSLPGSDHRALLAELTAPTASSAPTPASDSGGR
jgi:endonuclease/exonuclease/phosphatase (EEP) superfamily protein YafD